MVQAIRSFRWVILGEMSIALAGIGLIILGQARGTQVLSGVGAGIALVALVLAFYDTLNRERAMGRCSTIKSSTGPRSGSALVKREVAGVCRT